ncbi:MAG: vWA domain-containing protein [Bifidobacterium sp.]|nr:vWA domain-containing protein [Bifidobacterium sp.]
MNGFTFAPSLGWPVTIVICVAMAAAAVATIVLHARRRGVTDETLGMCVRRVAICVVVAVMALTPAIATSTTSRAVNATDVVIATDVTGSMGVKDARYGEQEGISRIDAARDAIADITKAYANSSFAAVSFGAQGTLDVPLTPDAQAIDNWGDALEPEPASASAGSSLDTALDALLRTLEQVHDAHPDDNIVLYLITDGEQTTPKTRRSFSALRRYLKDSCVIGVGSEAGGKIPQADGTYVTDPSTGHPGVSIMDAGQIKSLADELGGSYMLTTSGKTAVDEAIEGESRKWRQTQTVKEHTRVSPVTWPLDIILVALLAWECGAWFATSRRLVK